MLLIPCARPEWDAPGVLACICGDVNEKLGAEKRQLLLTNVATSVSRMLGCLNTINLKTVKQRQGVNECVLVSWNFAK